MAIETRSARMRMSVLGSVAFALFVALVARLWFLQVLNETEYDNQSEDNTTDLIIEPAPRGRILDVNGRVLVDNRPSIFITVDKGEMVDVSKDDRLAMFLHIAKEVSATGRLTKVAELEAKYQSNQYGPFGVVPVLGDITEDLQVYLAEHSTQFPGVHTRVEIVRDYPFGDLAAHILGYVGTLNEEELARVRSRPTDKPYLADDEIGKSGIELFYEDYLRGSPGRRTVVVDKFNNVLEERDKVPAQAGSDLWLTIDIDLQKMAEDQLRQGLALAREKGPQQDAESTKDVPLAAPAGSIVILDPRNGAVRALASYPTYDPALFSGGGISQAAFDELNDPSNHYPLINRVIQGTYPPGSTFKPFTAYAALDSGLLGPRGLLNPTAEYLDTGKFRIPECRGETCEFRNAGASQYGPVNLPLALTYSSDVYFYNLAAGFSMLSGFDDESPQHAAGLFGYGQTTGVTLPQESAGRLPTRAWKDSLCRDYPEAYSDCTWRTGDTLNTAIGQGDVLATPMQIANSYSALANGGTLYQPNVVAKVTDPVTKNEERTFGARVLRKVYYPDSFSALINEGLAGVTTLHNTDIKQGTAYRAFLNFPMESWPVSGKTGTSERQSAEPNKLIADTALFAAWGPAYDPQYAAAVVMEEAGFGGTYAAPVVRNIFEAIAKDSVPKAYNRDELAAQAAEAAAAALGEGDGTEEGDGGRS